VSGPFCGSAPSGDLVAAETTATFGGRPGAVTKATDPSTATTFGGREGASAPAPARVDMAAAYKALSPSTRETLLGLRNRALTPPALPPSVPRELAPSADPDAPAPSRVRAAVDAVVRHPATPWVAGALALGAVGAVAYRLARR
jgi:hypothetical protein